MLRSSLLFFSCLLLVLTACTDPIHESIRQWSGEALKSLAYEESLLEEVKSQTTEEQIKLVQRHGSYLEALRDLRLDLSPDELQGINSLNDEELDQMHVLNDEQQRGFKRLSDSYTREYIKLMKTDSLKLNTSYMKAPQMKLGVRYTMLLKAEVDLIHKTLETYY